MRITIVLLLMVVAATSVWAAGHVTLVADGTTVTSDPPAMIRDGRTYVPLRAAAEAVGGTVDYDPVARRVTICRGDLCTLVMQDDGITIGGRLLVGIRQVGEALNARVDWEAATRTVRITTMD